MTAPVHTVAARMHAADDDHKERHLWSVDILRPGDHQRVFEVRAHTGLQALAKVLDYYNVDCAEAEITGYPPEASHG